MCSAWTPVFTRSVKSTLKKLTASEREGYFDGPEGPSYRYVSLSIRQSKRKIIALSRDHVRDEPVIGIFRRKKLLYAAATHR